MHQTFSPTILSFKPTTEKEETASSGTCDIITVVAEQVAARAATATRTKIVRVENIFVLGNSAWKEDSSLAVWFL
jgi:hypothetical protein